MDVHHPMPVQMENSNQPVVVFTLIKSIGFSRSATITSRFYCLITECGFKSTDLSEFSFHIANHPVKWSGFCCACNAQIHNHEEPLMEEFKHMIQAHHNKEVDRSNHVEKTPFIACKLLPGDKLSKVPPEGKKSSLIQSGDFLKITNVMSLSTTLTRVIEKSTTTTIASSECNSFVNVTLKGWLKIPNLKSQKGTKKMLRDICLYALYKCMDINCTFSSSNAEDMKTHLENHKFTETDKSSNITRYLECAYCDEIADSSSSLVKHILDEHQSSIFQCPYCFYRSCAAYNVVVHLNQLHRTEKKKVLICNGQTKLYTTEKAFIEKSRRENIRPISCCEGMY